MADLVAPLPLIRVYGGMEVRLEAIDPTTGDPVAGVAVSDVAIYGRALDDDDTGAPLWTMYLTPQDA